MYALIHLTETVAEGYCRVVQVSQDTFEVHSDLIWVPCSDETVADGFVYRVSDQTLLAVEAAFVMQEGESQILDVEVM